MVSPPTHLFVSITNQHSQYFRPDTKSGVSPTITSGTPSSPSLSHPHIFTPSPQQRSPPLLFTSSHHPSSQRSRSTQLQADMNKPRTSSYSPLHSHYPQLTTHKSALSSVSTQLNSILEPRTNHLKKHSYATYVEGPPLAPTYSTYISSSTNQPTSSSSSVIVVVVWTKVNNENKRK